MKSSVLTKSRDSAKIRVFYVQSGKTKGSERFSKKSWKIREVLSFLVCQFRVILHTAERKYSAYGQYHRIKYNTVYYSVAQLQYSIVQYSIVTYSTL